jgi:hypothetical protein
LVYVVARNMPEAGKSQLRLQWRIMVQDSLGIKQKSISKVTNGKTVGVT